jgi:hypothetical protein
VGEPVLPSCGANAATIDGDLVSLGMCELAELYHAARDPHAPRANQILGTTP